MNIVTLAKLGEVRDMDGGKITPENALYGNIDRSASFEPCVKLGQNLHIGAVAVGGNCQIGNNTTILDGVYLDDNVHIKEQVRISEECTIFSQSTIEQMSIIFDNVIVGEKTTIPAEAQIGSDSVIPNTKTIACLGKFGTSNRVVTIHGSEDGPRYSIGCQYSVDWETISNRILHGTETAATSAAHYQNYLEVFNSIGATVQQYFDQELNHVQELREEAAIVRGLA